MINESRYQSAKIVSVMVESHFGTHLQAAKERDEPDLAPTPDAAIIEAIIDAAFWASLRREEGHAPKISLAYLPPSLAGNAVLFENRIPLSPAVLTKLSPGVERAGIHLGVWHEDNQIYIWGTTLRIPNLCFVLDVSEPGLLVIKHRRSQGFGKFANVAVLIGDQIKIVDDKKSDNDDVPLILQSLLGHSINKEAHDYVNVLIQMAVSMRSHKHGGTMLIVPEGNETWRESIIHPIKYSIKPSYSGIAALMKQEANEKKQMVWQTSLRRELDSIAGLTAVDGATIISDQYELLGFGAKIGRREGMPRVEQVYYCEPILGVDAIIVNPAQSGGTRHLSAAQFVHDQRNALSLVASQDGHFTIFTWSHKQNMVMAHRIDTLLL